MDTFAGVIIGVMVAAGFFIADTHINLDEQERLHKQKIECEQALPRNQKCQYVVVSPGVRHEKEGE